MSDSKTDVSQTKIVGVWFHPSHIDEELEFLGWHKVNNLNIPDGELQKVQIDKDLFPLKIAYGQRNNDQSP